MVQHDRFVGPSLLEQFLQNCAGIVIQLVDISKRRRAKEEEHHMSRNYNLCMITSELFLVISVFCLTEYNVKEERDLDIRVVVQCGSVYKILLYEH